MEPQIDRSVINLIKGIRHQESGGNYSAKGASGEVGAYQFLPKSFSDYATRFAKIPNADINNPVDQDKVAYHTIKAWKDSGKSPEQVLSMWNAGEGRPDGYIDHRGINAQGVAYDTPKYVNSIKSYLMANAKSSPTSTAPVVPQTNTSVVQEPPKQTLLDNSFTRGIQNFFAGKQIGNELGTSIAELSSGAKQLRDAEAKGLVPKGTYDETLNHPTFLQVAADVGNVILQSVGLPVASAGASAVSRIGIAALESAGVGGLSSIASGEKDIGNIAKDTAIGGTIGLATGGLIEGGASLFKGVKNMLSNKTAEEIESLARNPNMTQKDINKMSRSEQTKYYETKKADLDIEYKKAQESHENFVKEQEVNNKKDFDDLKSQLDTEGNIASQNLKEPVKQAIHDNSELFMEKVEKGFSEGKNMDTKVSSYKVEQALEEAIEDSERLDIAKKQFGLDNLITVADNGNITYKDTTLGDIWKKSKEIRQGMAATSKSGTRTFTKNEYDSVKNVKVLTDLLEKEGMNLSEANDFWTTWAKTRNEMVKQVRPFDPEGAARAPIEKTLKRSVANAEGSAAAKQFVDKLEETLGLQPGTLTSDIKDVVDKIDQNKLEKLNIAKIKKDIASELKAKKLGGVNNIENQRFNTDQIKKRQAVIKKVIIGALTTIGAAKAAHYISPAL